MWAALFKHYTHGKIQPPLSAMTKEKLWGLPLNRVLEDYDIITGTFFICGIQGENFSSLTEQQLQKYQQKFRCPEKFIPTPNGLLCLRIESVVTPKEKNKKPSNYER
ncbi:Uncharacterised protein [uncultured Ruminococcus sp.]|nr:Uncharacterised protein [uncultured Clostridium sp.]SCH99482.1 Uncharacterised protein [uncultured Ruminococcus sp.]